MSGPLSGVRVIDITSVAMGPYATQILGDMGADVIKVESREGDALRQFAPFRNRGMGAAFLNLNRNKRSIVLDLKTDKDRQVLTGLVKTSDVLIYNVRPQSMRKLGLAYDTLRTINPRLIYCGAYGFSEDGPYAGQPAFDDIIQAMSGLAYLQGVNGPDGPAYLNTIIADKTVGLTVAYAVAMALYAREKTGSGQEIEVPMFETMVSFTLVEHLDGQTFAPPLGPSGYDRILSPFRRPYVTKDGYLSLLPYTSEQCRRFFELADRPDIAANPRFMEPAERSKNINEMYGIIADIMKMKTSDEWYALLYSADIPVARVMGPEEVMADPHMRALGFFHSCEHPSEGEIVNIGIPTKFSETPGSIRRLAPTLGEHSEEILEELGFAGRAREAV